MTDVNADWNAPAMEDADFPPEPELLPPVAPGAAPAATPGTAPGVDQFYKVDVTKATFRECAWEAGLLGVVLGAFVKVFRPQLDGSTDDPAVKSLAPFEVPEAEIPPQERALLDPLVARLEALGFADPIFHRINNELQRTQTYLATLRQVPGAGGASGGGANAGGNSGGGAVARVHLRLWAGHQPPKQVLFVEFLSAFSDGGFLWSLSSKPDMLAPRSCTMIRRKGAAPEALWWEHQNQLKTMVGPRTLVPAGDASAARTLVEKHHAAVRDFHLGRGVFKPLNAEDERRLAALAENRRSLESVSPQNIAVLLELQRLQQKKVNWVSALVVLAVSLVLFAALGLSRDPWDDLLILVAVLFFHEGGHFLAMKVFGYRNVRMFFIPLFGAAVSGQHFTAPAWKKVIVSLMGPLPGILVGAIVGLIGAVLNQPLLVKIGVLAVIINAFNLLPVFPLDGGRVMHTLLFSRHYALDAVFRVLAALALIALSMALGTRFLMFFGIFMLIGVPLAFRLARVTAQLRADGVRPDMKDQQTIPTGVASVIVDKLQAGNAKRQNTKVLAQHTLHVFEGLASPPPSWGATIGLGALHAFSFFGALVVLAVLLVAQFGGWAHFGELWRLRRGAAMVPHSLPAGGVEVWRNSAPPDQDEPWAVVGTLTSAKEARAWFTDLKQKAPPGATLTLFGQSVVLDLRSADAATRERFIGEFSGRDAKAFVDNGGGNNNLTLQCRARTPAEAQALADECEAYLSLPPEAWAIAPWTPDDPRTSAQKEAHRVARLTYQKITQPPQTEGEAPEVAEMSKKVFEASRLGNRAEAARLMAEMQRIGEQREEARLRALAQSSAADVDRDLVEQYLALRARSAEKERWKPQTYAALWPRFGQLPLNAGRPKPGARQFSAQGNAECDGRTVSFHYVAWQDLAHGPPALVQWLESRGCTDFRYGLNGGYMGDVAQTQPELE